MRIGKVLTGKRMSTFVSASVVSLFIISGRMLWVSREYVSGQWRGPVWSTLIAAVIAGVIFPVVALAAQTVFEKRVETNFSARLIRVLFSALAVTAAIYVAIMSLEDIVLFVDEVMLLESGGVTVAAVILILCAYMSLSGASAIKKYGAVSLVFGAASAIGLLLLSAVRGEIIIKNLGEIFVKDGFFEMMSPSGILKAFFSVFAMASVALVWLSSSDKSKANNGKRVGEALVGLACGVLVLLVCFLNTALLLGLPFASVQTYPYASAVGSMTAGKLFMRPEGFLYLSYLSAAIVRVSVCVSTVCLLFEGISPSAESRRSRAALSFGAAAVIFVAYVLLFCF